MDVVAAFGCDTAAVISDEHRFNCALLAQAVSSCVECRSLLRPGCCGLVLPIRARSCCYWHVFPHIISRHPGAKDSGTT